MGTGEGKVVGGSVGAKEGGRVGNGVGDSVGYSRASVSVALSAFIEHPQSLASAAVRSPSETASSKEVVSAVLTSSAVA